MTMNASPAVKESNTLPMLLALLIRIAGLAVLALVGYFGSASLFVLVFLIYAAVWVVLIPRSATVRIVGAILFLVAYMVFQGTFGFGRLGDLIGERLTDVLEWLGVYDKYSAADEPLVNLQMITLLMQALLVLLYALIAHLLKALWLTWKKLVAYWNRMRHRDPVLDGPARSNPGYKERLGVITRWLKKPAVRAYLLTWWVMGIALLLAHVFFVEVMAGFYTWLYGYIVPNGPAVTRIHVVDALLGFPWTVAILVALDLWLVKLLQDGTLQSPLQLWTSYRKSPSLEAAQKALQAFGTDEKGLVLSQARTRRAKQGLPPDRRVTIDPWQTELTEELNQSNYQPSDMQKETIGRISRALDDRKPILLEETLTDLKLVIIASIIRRARDRGESILLLVEPDRLADLSKRLQDAELVIGSLMASNWHRLTNHNRPRSGETILYGTVDELEAVHFTSVESGDNSSTFGHFIARLGCVIVLEAQAIDFSQLRLKLLLLKYRLGDAHMKEVQFVIQSQPMCNLNDSLTNAIFGGSGPEVVSVADHQSQTTWVTVFDVDGTKRDRMARVSGDSPGDSFAYARPAIASLNALQLSVSILDIGAREPIKAWRELNEALRDPTGETALKTAPISVVGVPGSETSDTGTAVFLMNDGGNLSSALMRDLGSRGESEVLYLILSESNAYRDFIMASLKGKDVAQFYMQKQANAPFLAVFPDRPFFLREVLVMLAYRFRVARDRRLLETEVDQLLTEQFNAKPLMSNTEILEPVGNDMVGAGGNFTLVANRPDRIQHVFMRLFGVTLVFRRGRDELRRNCLDCAGFEEQLEKIIKGRTVSVSQAGGGLEFRLPAADVGLKLAPQSPLAIENSYFTVSSAGPGRLELEVSTSGLKHLGVMRREVFVRNYQITGAFMLHRPDVTIQGQFTFLAAHLDMQRKSVARHSYVEGTEEATALIGQPPTHKWVAFAGLLTFSCASPRKVAVTVALMLTLETVLRHRFPAVAHRISVGSADIDARLQQRLRPELARVSQAASVEAMAFLHPRDDEIRIIVIEDADHSLGIVTELDKAEVTEAWRAFVCHCAGARDPFLLSDGTPGPVPTGAAADTAQISPTPEDFKAAAALLGHKSSPAGTR